MHLQSTQHVYYVTSIQNTALPIHMSQQHSNHHFMHRLESIPAHSSISRNDYTSDSKAHFCPPTDVDPMSFRKENRNGCFTSDPQASRFVYGQYSNNEVPPLAGSRTTVAANLENIRNKTVIQIKRKQSVNLTSRDGREQYYKGPQVEELMNKLPQLDLQPLNRAHPSRLTHTSPPPELKTGREIKKATSPFHIHNRSVYYKEANLQIKLSRKGDSHESAENKQPRQFIRFNSPIRNFPTGFQSPEKQCLNPERKQYTQSGCSTKRQSNADTSNSCSTLFQSDLKLQQSIPSSRFTSATKSKPAAQLPQCPIQISQQYTRQQNDQPQQLSQIDGLITKERYRRLEQELENQKLTNSQYEAKLRKLEQQLNQMKQRSEKTLQDLKKQQDQKKQTEIQRIKEEYQRKMKQVQQDAEDQISKNQRKNEQQSQNYQRIQGQLEKALKAIQYQKNRLSQSYQEKQQRLGSVLSQKQELEAANLELEKKVHNLQQEMISHQQRLYEVEQRIRQPVPDVVANSQLIEQNRSLESKLSVFLASMEKQVAKYKQCKGQLQKSYRRIEELNVAIYEKDNNIKNMLKELRNRDKFIAQLKRNLETMNVLVGEYTQDIVKINIKAKDQKYRQIINETPIAQVNEDGLSNNYSI